MTRNPKTDISNSSLAIAGAMVSGFDWLAIEMSWRDALLTQGLSGDEVDFQVEAAKVMRAVNRIHTLIGTERELGSERIVTEDIYNEMRQIVSDALFKIRRMSPGVVA
ncbi:hypothetical protein RlegWSM1455_07225 [Rhizobium laguerreae]|uniref:hypothetical protein n=1 Tax=Rhizobium laguerreae TaxID=1076926 RepID=UPI001E629447|nr:hypothetical protein [Rhizobium laguerreae]UFW65806.1 hypothetical protein RlegWSM1455_07225 [Rhizobium laguerreae]